MDEQMPHLSEQGEGKGPEVAPNGVGVFESLSGKKGAGKRNSARTFGIQEGPDRGSGGSGGVCL